MAEGRYRKSSGFRHEFPGVSMSQGYRFRVHDCGYRSSCQLSEVDYGYDVPKAVDPRGIDSKIYKVLEDGTADMTHSPSG
jgi:hypothetical protein